MRDLPVLVMLAVHEEKRLAALLQKSEIIFINGRADANQTPNALVRDTDFHPDARAERETGERQRCARILCCQIVKSNARIFSLAATFIMFASALADAAKVDPQRDESGVVERARGAKDHFVVHRAAAQRVRVKHERDTTRVPFSRLLQNRFEATVR